MENMDYESARRSSKGLFKNALVLPVGHAIAEEVVVGGDFTASDVRQWIGGRAESNQIRDALGRFESAEAIIELPYPGQPHPHRWERLDHPVWDFITEWSQVPAKG